MPTQTSLKTIGEFLSNFERVKQLKPDTWEALCPAHNDHNPSLHITLTDNSKILINCKAGCLPNTILQSVGLTMSHLYLNSHHKADKPLKEIVNTYPYHSHDGQVLFEVVRFKPKGFAQRRPDGNGGWLWDLRGIEPVIYHLPEVKEAINQGKPIYFCEGEKDTDNLRALGVTATCNPMGAGKWRRSYCDQLTGASEIRILADNDAPGRKHATQAASFLHEAGISTKVLDMPTDSIKDVTDWIEQGLVLDQLEISFDGLPPFTPPPKSTFTAERRQYNKTDLGNAERLIDQYGDTLRYCYDRKSWLVWKGSHWHWDLGGGEVMRLAQLTVRSIYEEAAREDDYDERKKIVEWARISESNMRLNAMVAQAAPLAKISLIQLDTNSWLFNCRNGTINLKTGDLNLHNKGDYITVVAPVDYKPEAVSEEWLKFMGRICGNNENLVGYLQRCIGYTLTGLTSEQCFFFAHGTGMNGKSTFLNTFKKILSPYAAQANTETFLIGFKSQGGHNEDLANLAGKRFVVATEADDNRRLAVSKVKQMTGGEKVRASHKYEREFEYEVTYKIWLNANHKPAITDSTYSIWRRVKLIPFNEKIEKSEEIADYAEKLYKNYSTAILTWAVQGCLDWQRQGLGEPPEVTNATEEYRLDQDILGDFFQSRCYLSLDAECVVAHIDLYAAYQIWCSESSIDPVTSRTFSRKMKERDHIQKYIRRGQLKWRYIRLLEENEEQQGVDEVDTVDESSRTFFHEENMEKLLEIAPCSSTPATNDKVSSTPPGEEGVLSKDDALSMLDDYLGMKKHEILGLWEKSGRPELILSKHRLCTDLGAELNKEKLHIDDIAAIADFIKTLWDRDSNGQ